MLRTSEDTLDPSDWNAFRLQGHRMLDDMIDYLEHLRDQPVWQPMQEEVRNSFRQALDDGQHDLEKAHELFMKDVLPYALGNAHPGFMGWVHGGGTPVGMLAEMLAAGLNANLGGRDQAPIEIERQVVQWVRELFNFPETASGLFVTGTSMANLLGVLIARTALLGNEVRHNGLTADNRQLVAYTSADAHVSNVQAMDIAGFGSDALRMIPVDHQHQMDITALELAIAENRKAGMTPFFIVGTVGSVGVGAIDNLQAIAELCQREHIWFHVDGAYGALAMLAPEIAPRLRGIEWADSIAFDFHKWGQVPYDAGFILVRNGELHQNTFASPTAYLKREARGMAAGSPWPCDFGPDLSRGFRALKTWFTIKVYGAEKLGQVIANTCALAQHMKRRIEDEPKLELLAPVALNIVCFRYRNADANRFNADLVVALQESGITAPSTTIINGQLAIRAAIVNHRTTIKDIDALIDTTLALGKIVIRNTQPKEKTMHTNESTAPLIGLAKLMRMAYSDCDLTPLGTELIARAETDTGGHALMDLSTVLQLRGNRDIALNMQAQAIQSQQIYSPPTAAGQVNIRLLAIMGPGDLMANTPLEFLLENSDVALDIVYVTEDLPLPANLPDHDVLFVAVAQSDRNMPLLKQIDAAIASWPRPVLNKPDRIALMSRTEACSLLKSTPGIEMPITVRIARKTLQRVARQKSSINNILAESGFPIIIRPVDSHAGKDLDKIEDSNALTSYLKNMPNNEFYISRFVNYRSPDGLFRKYRIVLIDGKPFVCHAAISEHWIIHYLNAGMAESPEKRAEEERFMLDFDSQFAIKHAEAFRAIKERAGLDYLGIDCGESADGKLLIFEIDSCMIVHAIDPADLFPYKQPQMNKVFGAFRQMLENAMQRS
ncbi:MAG: aminotransferase class V-fold PLP-dependent enzyme [Methylobacter sp.]